MKITIQNKTKKTRKGKNNVSATLKMFASASTNTHTHTHDHIRTENPTNKMASRASSSETTTTTTAATTSTHTSSSSSAPSRSDSSDDTSSTSDSSDDTSSTSDDDLYSDASDYDDDSDDSDSERETRRKKPAAKRVARQTPGALPLPPADVPLPQQRNALPPADVPLPPVDNVRLPAAHERVWRTAVFPNALDSTHLHKQEELHLPPMPDYVTNPATAKLAASTNAVIARSIAKNDDSADAKYAKRQYSHVGGHAVGFHKEAAATRRFYQSIVQRAGGETPRDQRRQQQARDDVAHDEARAGPGGGRRAAVSHLSAHAHDDDDDDDDDDDGIRVRDVDNENENVCGLNDMFLAGLLSVEALDALRDSLVPTWTVCNSCGSHVMQHETGVCCHRGERVVRDEDFPKLTDEFKRIVIRYRDVTASASASIAASLCFGRLGFACEGTRGGLHFPCDESALHHDGAERNRERHRRRQRPSSSCRRPRSCRSRRVR